MAAKSLSIPKPSDHIGKLISKARYWRKSGKHDYGISTCQVIYVFSDGNGWNKIGRSKDVGKRQKEIQYGNPSKLRLVAYLPCVGHDCSAKIWPEEWDEELGFFTKQQVHVIHATKHKRFYKPDDPFPRGPQCYCESVAISAETTVHRALRDVRGMGEWFYCDSVLAFEALKLAATKIIEPVDLCVGWESEAKDGR